MTAHEPTIERQKRANHAAWTDPALIASWRAWSPMLTTLLRAATDCVVDAGPARPRMHVLDLASGTGEPALSLAAAVAPTGTVTATDLSHDMLAAARENATRAGIRNLRFQIADAHDLPFADASFDLVTCRFGVMYFADVALALQNIHRVLVPGGRLVLLAWGPADQPYFRHTRGIVAQNVDLRPDPDAPDTFAFAAPGSLSRPVRAAGFVHVTEQALTLDLSWPGPPETLWRFFCAMTASFAALRERLSPATWDNITREVHDALRPYYDGEMLRMPGLVNLVTASKPRPTNSHSSQP